jgi:preprotein translocase subunit SecA
MGLDLAHTLPRPGPLWGQAPQRQPDHAPPARSAWQAWRGEAHCRAMAQAAHLERQPCQALTRDALVAACQDAAAGVRRQGFVAGAVAPLLGRLAALAEATLGLAARPGQLMAAAALLDNRLAEMPTGEGKSLATALAACGAALAGVPVHVVTANDYLAERDAAGMRPLADALGLSVAFLRPGDGDDAKRATYAADIVCATAKELAFDHLRDRLDAPPGLHDELARRAAALADRAVPAPRMRGLCMALIDEADSVLLDEADVPLVLSRSVPHAARRAFLWQALALARRLEAQRHFALHAATRRAELTPEGDDELARAGAALGGPWLRPRYRREAVAQALVALHLLQRDHHYLLRGEGREAKVEIIDEVTGRGAPGRVWSHGLHTLVELKEGLVPSADSQTLARTTFQRFFQRYWRLAGLSGTLWESRGELARVFGASVVRVPREQPLRCKVMPTRAFATMEALFDAVVAQTRAMHAQGRPVLIGTDSVADSCSLSRRLAAAGLAHQVLNAVQDRDEAALVARAGQAGAITVATRMAGRGTDIQLDQAARAAGGLHVICSQHNPSRRLDRQLAGRAARHGDPGSVQLWWIAAPSHVSIGWLGTILAACNRTHAIEEASWGRPQWLLRRLRQWPQRAQERQREAQRAQLLRADRAWERRLAFAGPPA